MTREQAWKRFVEDYEIQVPESKIQNEMNLIRMDLRHRMQYEMLTGAEMHLFPEMELDQKMEEIRELAVFEVKSQLVMKAILAQQDFPVTQEDLEAEAAAMAQRQNTTVELIKGFFGEDLAMLARDIKERKAVDWVCNMG